MHAIPTTFHTCNGRIYTKEKKKRTKAWKKIGEEILSLLLFVDVLLMAENKEQLQTLLKEAETFSKDIQMNFGIEKCKVMIIKKRK